MTRGGTAESSPHNRLFGAQTGQADLKLGNHKGPIPFPPVTLLENPSRIRSS